MNLQQLKTEQLRRAPLVQIPKGLRPDFPQPGDQVITMDVQYAGQNDAFVAMELIRWGGPEQQLFLSHQTVTTDYHPGYFAFREGPVLANALQALAEKEGIHPDLLIIDGHGLAHPRKFGVASWLGLELGIPSIGVAKEPLVRYQRAPSQDRGSTAPILVDGEVVGAVLRTVAGVKPIFVSPGHLVSLEESIAIAMSLAGPYRVIEPIRRADQACRAFARGEIKDAIEV